MKQSLFWKPLIFASSLFACTPNADMEPDLEKPVIEVSEPQSYEAFHAGQDFEFKATVTDNKALGTLNLTIHGAFDSHAHSRLASALTPFAMNLTYPIEGVSADISEAITIPGGTLAGPYHFILQATDADGNGTTYEDASTKEITILLTNDSQAKVKLDLAAGEDELDGQLGQTLAVSGTIEDMDGEFGEVVIRLTHEEESEGHEAHAHRMKNEGDLYHEDFDLTTPVSTVAIEELIEQKPIMLPETTDEEHLILIIQVEDEQGNLTISRTPVHLEK